MGKKTWDIVKSSVNNTIKSLKLELTEEQKEDLQLLFNQEVTVDRAEQVENDLHLSLGVAEVYVKILEHLYEPENNGGAGQKSGDQDDNVSAGAQNYVELWQSVADALEKNKPLGWYLVYGKQSE